MTLHNQRDFLFFRRHRYAFASLEKAKLQEIGPRFTLKLRWLRKGLPTVTAADGRIPGGGDADDLNTSRDIEDEDQRDEDEAMEEMQAGIKAPKAKIYVPALDQEEEFEWKWTVSSPDWHCRLELTVAAQDEGLSADVLFVMYWGTACTVSYGWNGSPFTTGRWYLRPQLAEECERDR